MDFPMEEATQDKRENREGLWRADRTMKNYLGRITTKMSEEEPEVLVKIFNYVKFVYFSLSVDFVIVNKNF